MGYGGGTASCAGGHVSHPAHLSSLAGLCGFPHSVRYRRPAPISSFQTSEVPIFPCWALFFLLLSTSAVSRLFPRTPLLLCIPTSASSSPPPLFDRRIPLLLQLPSPFPNSFYVLPSTSYTNFPWVPDFNPVLLPPCVPTPSSLHHGSHLFFSQLFKIHCILLIHFSSSYNALKRTMDCIPESEWACWYLKHFPPFQKQRHYFKATLPVTKKYHALLHSGS